MSVRSLRRSGIVLAGFTMAASLAGCSPDAPVPSPSATVSPAPSSTAAPTATPTATPTPIATVVPAAATCENLLDPDRLADILASGFNVNSVNDYVNKIRGEGSPLALFDEYGGVVCPVNNGFRVAELYAYSAIAPDAQAAEEARLAAEGWVQSAVDGGTLYVDPVVQEGIVFAYYFRNGYWWCGYDASVITMIVSNSPAS